MIKQTDALGHATTYTYDANGNQLTQTTTLTTPSGVQTLVTTTKYDANGRRTIDTDAEGNTTKTEYDANGHQTATIDGLGHRTSFVYDTRGELVETDFPDGTKSTTPTTPPAIDVSTDQAGRTTTYRLRPLGRLVETTTPTTPRRNTTSTTKPAR